MKAQVELSEKNMHVSTGRKLSEKFKHLSAAIFDSAAEAILVTDADKNIISVNPAFTRITGYSAEEVLGKNPRIFQSGRHNRAFYKEMWERITSTGHWQGEIWNRRKNGETYPEWLSITAVENENNHLIQYTALFSDITKRKEGEMKLELQAYYDPLTNLPNRTLFLGRLSQAIKQARRSKRKAALIFIDLDRFKQVNDTLGHTAGDKILRMAAKRFLSCVRETDTVARAGGDEFLIVLSDVKGRREASIVAKEILEKLSKPFKLDGQDISFGASIGISIAPDDGEEAMVLIDNADMAMYKVKTSGRGNHHFFNDCMQKFANERAVLEGNLQAALEKQELVVHYQPVVDLQSLKTVSLEALIRWDHPEIGLLLPDRFITQSSTIGKIDAWIIRTACTQVKQWQDQFGIETSLSVNVSTRQLKYGDFSTVLNKALNKSGFPPESLILEVPERAITDSSDELFNKISRLKEIGIRLAIDRFGTGQSSLPSLLHYPIDQLKIDPSFIHRLVSEQEVQQFVRAIVGIGRCTKLTIIAEGVETQKEIACLKRLSCDAAQGRYFGQTLSASEYESILKGDRKKHSAS